MALKEFVTVRIPKDIFEKAKTAAKDLGDPGAAWIIVRSVIEMMELADTEEHARRVPRIVRTLDAARSEGAMLTSGETRRGSSDAQGGHRKYVVKAGRG